MILIAALLVASLAVWLGTLLLRSDGAAAVITVDGEEIVRLALDEDASVTIGEGEHKNTVVVKNGAVCVADASCPDHICMNTGWIEFEGEMIVCLPNKLVVTVEGGADSATDAVTG